ncbi:SRR1-like protein [Diadema setosum]|uniref:SRR1-like protein n=1 Tax=Diadema setosum TaxID=31175 RepID=UPI003B3BB3D7
MDDEFRVVSKKNKRRNRHPRGAAYPRVDPLQAASARYGDLDNIDATTLSYKIKSSVEDLQISSFFRDFQESWKSFVHLQTYEQSEEGAAVSCHQNIHTALETPDCQSGQTPDVTPGSNAVEMSNSESGSVVGGSRSLRRIEGIVCYGLGNFSSCVTARYQLSLLILMESVIPGAKCSLYDPNFTEVEKEVIRDLGFTCIDHNEEGKRQVVVPTLFYMPHCGKPLYNNLLWANWGLRLASLIILGNSFNNFADRFTSKQLHEEVPYIQKILPYHQEVPVRNSFQYTDIFNDMAIHAFPPDALGQAPADLWTDCREPCYDHMDSVEIILDSSRR